MHVPFPFPGPKVANIPKGRLDLKVTPHTSMTGLFRPQLIVPSPVGGRLHCFAENSIILDDPFVLRLLRDRYLLILIVTPPTTYKLLSHQYPVKQLPILTDAVENA